MASVVAGLHSIVGGTRKLGLMMKCEAVSKKETKNLSLRESSLYLIVVGLAYNLETHLFHLL